MITNNCGFYFVTICTKDKVCDFGEVRNGKIELSEIGEIAYKFWEVIPSHFDNVHLEEFIIIPNHIHGIIVIDYYQKSDSDDRTKMFIPKILHGYKSSVTREIRKSYNNYSFKWQKSYYDRIIHTENELNKTRQYIINNPTNWTNPQPQINLELYFSVYGVFVRCGILNIQTQSQSQIPHK